MKRERESSKDENGTTKKVKAYVKEFSDALLKACSLGKTLQCYRDMTKLIEPINSRRISLRNGNGMETSLMSDEERRFMWNLAFFFTISYRGVAFKAFYAIRSFITFHGIFMGPGYDLGDESIWRFDRWGPFIKEIERRREASNEEDDSDEDEFMSTRVRVRRIIL